MKIKFNFKSIKKNNKVQKGEFTNFENVENENEKKRRRKKENLNDGEILEPHENKRWKRKGSKTTVSEFLSNIFLNKKRIKYNYYVLLFAMISLSVLSVYKTGKTYIENNTEEYESLSAFNLQNGEEIDLNKNVSSIFEERNLTKEVIENNDGSNDDNNINKEENENVSIFKNIEVKEETLNFGKPLENIEIQKIYSIDAVIYSKTLDMWKIHNGIDLKADLGTSVLAVEKGTVSKIYDDSFLGKTVVITHINGYMSSYSNLEENVNVEVNQTVKKGQKIGAVGSSAIGEIKDEPHLHFMLFKDNEITDPSVIIYE